MSADYSMGAAYIDGRFMPLSDAAIPVTDRAYRQSDVTYDVVSVWNGHFFRLDDHIARFRRSMTKLRMSPVETDAQIRDMLAECVRLSGLREAYVAMDCSRGAPPAGVPNHPAYARNYLIGIARRYSHRIAPEAQKRGAFLVTASVTRIPEQSIDPTVKNFHWADFNVGSFEAHDAGADGCVLLDLQGNLTEGPGYNIFLVRNGTVTTPDRGTLAGITQKTVFELCSEVGIPCEFRRIPKEDMYEADEMFATSTAGGIMPVTRIDQRVLSSQGPGAVASRLRDLYWSKRAEGWLGTPVPYDARGPVFRREA